MLSMPTPPMSTVFRCRETVNMGKFKALVATSLGRNGANVEYDANTEYRSAEVLV